MVKWSIRVAWNYPPSIEGVPAGNATVKGMIGFMGTPSLCKMADWYLHHTSGGVHVFRSTTLLKP